MKKVPKVGQFAVRTSPCSGIDYIYRIEQVFSVGDTYEIRGYGYTCEEITVRFGHEYVPIHELQKVCDTELQAEIWLTERDLKQAKKSVVSLTNELAKLKGES